MQAIRARFCYFREDANAISAPQPRPPLTASMCAPRGAAAGALPLAALPGAVSPQEGSASRCSARAAAGLLFAAGLLWGEHTASGTGRNQLGREVEGVSLKIDARKLKEVATSTSPLLLI